MVLVLCRLVGLLPSACLSPPGAHGSQPSPAATPSYVLKLPHHRHKAAATRTVIILKIFCEWKCIQVQALTLGNPKLSTILQSMLTLADIVVHTRLEVRGYNRGGYTDILSPQGLLSRPPIAFQAIPNNKLTYALHVGL